jgi:predicted kinase
MNHTMILMCGLQCSGKSTLARRLSNAFGIELISNDIVRVEFTKNPGIMNTNPLERGVIYYLSQRRAEDILSKGQGVIIDATFSQKIFRQGAYYTAAKTGASIYLIHTVCNNYGLIKKRYEQRQEQKKNNTHLFDEWSTIEPFHKLFQEFESPDREVLPDGTPVPIIRYDSEKGRAEIIYSDGSNSIQRILEVINNGEAK